MSSTITAKRDSDLVPFTRLDNSDPELFRKLMQAVERIASQAAFTGGGEVEAFDAEFAEYCGTEHAVGVSSGTEALALSMRALGIGPGDEVIVPANSFIATAEAVSLVGARPRLVDVDPDTHLITAETLERSITPGTRCVIPVHLYGRTVDLDPIVEIARERGAVVIEDACQAHGAIYRNRRAGSIADAGCFSFYPAKNLGAWGDGGAVVTNNPGLADQVRLLRSHGERPRYRHRVCGSTSRLDALQAAVLRVKLMRLDGWNTRRRTVAARYADLLKGGPVELPAPASPEGDHVYHLFVVTSARREELREHLHREGVASGIHYPAPIHLSDAYAHLGMRAGELPVAERLAGRVCSLPIFPSMSESETDRVAEVVTAFAAEEH